MISLVRILFFAFVASQWAFADAPVISAIADQRASQGELYFYAPKLSINQNTEAVLWTKAYGPDEVSVDPNSGNVYWSIPADLPSESYHIGITAATYEGEYTETWIVTVGDGQVVYIGPNESITNLKAGMAAISSGDTLVMRNGLWDGSKLHNTIPGITHKTQALPAGTKGAFTSLMAEDPGQVIIDGQHKNSTLRIYGSTRHPDWPLANNGFTGITDYVAVKGLVLVNSSSEALRVDYSRYIKLIDIGVGASASISAASYPNVYIHRSQYVLIEGMYVWGHGRYKIQFKDSSHSMVRRSVVRIDDTRVADPIGGFIAYCSRDIEFQNNIVIDSDSSDFWLNHTELIAAFGVPATNCWDYPQGIVFRNSLALNTHMGLMATQARDNINPTLWQDIVGWDMAPSRHYAGKLDYSPVLSAVGATVSNQITVGEVSTTPGWFLYSRSQDSTVSNSSFYRLGWDGEKVLDADLIRFTQKAFYFKDNNLAGFKGALQDGSNVPDVINLMRHDPGYRYITQLPEDSRLKKQGKNGQRVGAELLMMAGRANTFYGEDGYNHLTTVPMWPFPGEKNMARHMKSYFYTGPTRSGMQGELTGDRGFAKTGESLTDYVWGYLGSPLPPMQTRVTPGDGSVTIKWRQPAGNYSNLIKEYRIYNMDLGEQTWIGAVPAGEPLLYTVEALENNLSVKFGVSSVYHDGRQSDIVYPVRATPREAYAQKAFDISLQAPPEVWGKVSNGGVVSPIYLVLLLSFWGLRYQRKKKKNNFAIG